LVLNSAKADFRLPSDETDGAPAEDVDREA
jgi:hypothetical protein